MLNWKYPWNGSDSFFGFFLVVITFLLVTAFAVSCRLDRKLVFQNDGAFLAVDSVGSSAPETWAGLIQNYTRSEFLK